MESFSKAQKLYLKEIFKDRRRFLKDQGERMTVFDIELWLDSLPEKPSFWRKFWGTK